MLQQKEVWVLYVLQLVYNECENISEEKVTAAAAKERELHSNVVSSFNI